MAGLTAHHAAADDASRALDGNAPFRPLYEHDEGHHGGHAYDQQEHGHKGEGAPCIGLDLLIQIAYTAGQTGDNAREDEQAHAVADATVGDLLAQPMMKAVPVVSVSTVISMNPGPGLSTMPPLLSMMAMPIDWSAARTTVI